MGCVMDEKIASMAHDVLLEYLAERIDNAGMV